MVAIFEWLSRPGGGLEVVATRGFELLLILVLIAFRIAKDVALGAGDDAKRWFARAIDLSILPLMVLLLGLVFVRVLQF